MPFIIPVVAAASEAIAVIGSFVAATGFIGQAVIAAGIGIASSYILSALSPKPNTSDAAPAGVSFERQYGNNIARQVASGLVGMAGHDTYINTFGVSNESLQQIYTLSDYYSTRLTRVALNGNYVALGDPNGVGRRAVLDGDFANLIYVTFLNGHQTIADNGLVAGANPSDRWTTANVGVGITAVIVEMIYDKDKNNSFPDFFFEFEGAPYYDPRKDSTAGGSGSHRFNDVTTHEFTKNPIVIEYNYRRGLRVNGDFFCGMDMPASDLPFDKWVTAMNICDEIQPDGKPLYECSVILNCMAIHSDNLQSIALSCGAMQIDGVDGSWPLVGSDQPAVATFTDEDIVSVSDFKRSERISMQALVNSVSGNFPDPDQLWSMIGYQEQVASDFVVIDRRTRDVNIDFPQVCNSRQAAQLAWIYLYENRFEARATVTLRPRFQTIEAGDWIEWNSARYGIKTFIVTGKQLLSLDSDGPRNAVLTLQERDGSIYNGVTPPAIVLPFPPGEPAYLSEVESFALVAVSVVGANGIAQAAIRASWFSIIDTTVVGVDLMYFPTDQPDSILHKSVLVGQTVVLLAEGVVGNTNYTVRAKLLTSPSRTTVYNAGATITTLDIGIGLAQFDVGLQYQVTTLLNKFDDRIANMEQLISATASNQNTRQWNNKQMIQRQLMSVTGSLTASIDEVLTVATDTQEAFASYQLTVSAEFASQAGDIADNTAAIVTNSASISTNATAIANLSSSFASYQVDVTATFAGQTALISSNTTAIATVDHKLLASWSMTTNVAGHISGLKQLNDGTIGAFIIEADVFKIASPSAFGYAPQNVFTLQTVGGGTSLALRGDFFADGTITSRVIAAGEVKTINLAAQAVRAGNIEAGSITSASGVIGALGVSSLNIADNAVTVPVVQTINTVTGSSGTVSSFNLTIDTAGLGGKPIGVFAMFNGLISTQGLPGSSATLFINNTQVAVGQQNMNANMSSATMNIVVTGGYSFFGTGGVVTIPVRVDVNLATLNNGSAILLNRTLFAMGAKR